MTVLSTLLAFIVALGVLIAFHEFGHYVAARACGVKVLRYCLGFGKPVFMRCMGADGTEWAIAAFPLGGYVKLLGQDPDEAVEAGESHRSFSVQPVWKRMIIIVAGPLANFLLAITLYWGLNLGGVEEPPAKVATPVAGSLAAQAGLAEGDLIVAADAATVASWNDLHWRLLRAAEARIPVRLETRNHRGEIGFPVLDLGRLASIDLEGDFMKSLGLELFRPPPRVVLVEDASPAARAGLAAGDVLVAVNGRPVRTAADFVAAVRAAPGMDSRIDMLRAGRLVQLRVTPAVVAGPAGSVGRIGASVSDRPQPVLVRYGLTEALSRAVVQTGEMSAFSLRMMGKMIIGEVSWRNLSGPVTIADYAGKTARLGLAYYLNFLALVSISLGVLNLLPVPMLDGGHLMYYFLEVLRGRPVSEKVAEIGTKVGLAIVMTTMVLALFNDIHRLLAG